MRAIVSALALLALASPVFGAEHPAAPASTEQPLGAMRGMAAGYLAADEMPSSVALVPKPPEPESAALARDEEANRRALALQGSARWDLAGGDAVLTFPEVAGSFSCALNAAVGDAQTPRLMHLLRRTLADAGRSTAEAKRRYQRARPFMINGKPTCTPQRENVLRTDGSYPSGHAAIGYAFGLVLSEIAPAQAAALLARGREFGHSRVVCNVHWPSDVIEGQLMGAAVVARLHAEADFRADVEAARVELTALRSQANAPLPDCKLETRALEPSP